MTYAPTAQSLTARERQVLQGLAEGDTLHEVAGRLGISHSTAQDALRAVRFRLFAVKDVTAAVAVGYATSALARPVPLDPVGLDISPGQRALVPLLARGMSAEPMAAELGRPLAGVRRDGRELLALLRARTRPHAITRAWQYELLTAEQVCAWLPPDTPIHLPGKREVLALTDEVLDWHPAAPPARETCAEALDRLVRYGLVLAVDLRTLRSRLPADCAASRRARAALGEAHRRLIPPTALGSTQGYAGRAQSAARLIRALLQAIDAATAELDRPALSLPETAMTSRRRAVLYRCTSAPISPPNYGLDTLIRHAAWSGYWIVGRAVEGRRAEEVPLARRPAWRERVWPRLSGRGADVLVVQTLDDLGTTRDHDVLFPQLAGLRVRVDCVSQSSAP